MPFTEVLNCAQFLVYLSASYQLCCDLRYKIIDLASSILHKCYLFSTHDGLYDKSGFHLLEGRSGFKCLGITTIDDKYVYLPFYYKFPSDCFVCIYRFLFLCYAVIAHFHFLERRGALWDGVVDCC